MVGGVEQSARLVSFELVEWRLIWKERRAETQHMNVHPLPSPIQTQATSLMALNCKCRRFDWFPPWSGIHSKKRTTCSGLMKTALNNAVLPILFNVFNTIVQHCWAWISPQSGVTMLNNIVDNIEQCGQHNIVQGCFHRPWTGCAFLRVYSSVWSVRLKT